MSGLGARPGRDRGDTRSHSLSARSHAGSRGRIALLMLFEAATVALIASLHLTEVLGGGRKPFRPAAAGIAEAIIGVVLVCGAAALLRGSRQARTIALAATAFAILGFIVGLTFTVRGGGTIDIAYHATLLPLLVLTLLLLTERRRAAVSERRYLKPPWMQRHVANRLVPLFRKDIVSKLSVRGRKSGRWRTVPVAVLEDGGERYLVSYRGASDWALNLAAHGRGRLTTRDGEEEISVVEVPLEQRSRLLAAYERAFGKMPTVAAVLRALPDPADHPIFRIDTTSSAEGGPQG